MGGALIAPTTFPILGCNHLEDIPNRCAGPELPKNVFHSYTMGSKWATWPILDGILVVLKVFGENTSFFGPESRLID